MTEPNNTEDNNVVMLSGTMTFLQLDKYIEDNKSSPFNGLLLGPYIPIHVNGSSGSSSSGGSLSYLGMLLGMPWYKTKDVLVTDKKPGTEIIITPDEPLVDTGYKQSSKIGKDVGFGSIHGGSGSISSGTSGKGTSKENPGAGENVPAEQEFSKEGLDLVNEFINQHFDKDSWNKLDPGLKKDIIKALYEILTLMKAEMPKVLEALKKNNIKFKFTIKSGYDINKDTNKPEAGKFTYGLNIPGKDYDTIEICSEAFDGSLGNLDQYIWRGNGPSQPELWEIIAHEILHSYLKLIKKNTESEVTSLLNDLIYKKYWYVKGFHQRFVKPW